MLTNRRRQRPLAGSRPNDSAGTGSTFRCAAWLALLGVVGGCQAPVLVSAKTHAAVVVEYDTEPTEKKVTQLRRRMCNRSTQGRIYYQLVMADQWHYYWVCPRRRPRSAATDLGERRLKGWAQQMRERAGREAHRCRRRRRQQIFSQRHSSGTMVRAYCDRRIIFRFLDGTRKQYRYALAEVQQPAPAPKSPSPATNETQSSSTASSSGVLAGATPPASQSEAAQPTCPPCTAARRKANTRRQGMRLACEKLCPAIYDKCRQIDPKTAMCHLLSEHCSTLRGVCR